VFFGCLTLCQGLDFPGGPRQLKGVQDQARHRSGNLVLDLLHAIRGDIASLKSNAAELKERVGLLEAQDASISRGLDRVGGDAEQIKRRLDLVGAKGG
jgi:hypothetical protein